MECDLNTLQVWAGYLSWLGLFKVLGAAVIAAGVLALTWGVVVQIVMSARILLEIIGYALSAALIASGLWVSPDNLTWTVMVGCLLFAGSVFLTLWIHNIKGDDPKGLAALFMLVWGAVAIYYNMTEVGFLAILALMTMLGFTAIAAPLRYVIGFHDRSSVPGATAAALLIVVVFIIVKLGVSNPSPAIAVFMPGAFWAGSFVAFTGLLIISSRYYTENGSYLMAQVLMIGVSAAALFVGMTYGINPLAGIAGTFLVLYLASKPMEIEPEGLATVGVMLLMMGGIMYGAWYWAMQNEPLVRQYLTTSL